MKISFTKKAAKDLKKIQQGNPVIFRKIVESIKDLAENPFPNGCKKLKGEDDAYRIRVGSYRVLYTVKDAELLIEVFRVGPRGDVYKHITQ
ncbi:type II toxin-antitoxin system RelE family toxin [Corynebacterium matruchotii]|jgi:addiction module toxin, relE/stbE family